MKTLILAVALATIAVTAVAASTSTSSTTSNSASNVSDAGNSQSNSGVTNSGNSGSASTTANSGNASQGITTSGNVSGNSGVTIDTVNNTKIPVSTAFAPQLSSSNDTCMGSSSLGASGPGFSVSTGSTWSDANCVMLKNAREMWNMGMRDAAFARLCMDEKNHTAMNLVGMKCPQDLIPVELKTSNVYEPKVVSSLTER